MALTTTSKQVGEYVYTVTSLPARKGRSVAVRLAKLLAPVAGQVGGKVDEAGAISALLSNLSDEDLAFVSDEFAACTTYQKVGDSKSPMLKDTFDLHFAARYGDMVQWLLFCVEVNFGSFLGQLGVALPQAPMLAAA